MNLPNYDSWKLDTPPRYEDAPAERIECPSCGEIVEELHGDGVCFHCWRQAVGCDPPPDDDEPDDADTTPLIEGDDPDEYIDDFSPLFRDEPQEGGAG